MTHEIIEVERNQLAPGHIRVSAYVVVEGQPSRDDLERLAADLSGEFRRTDSYAALWLGFYDRREYADNRGSAPLGHWIDAPHGRLRDAVGQDAGDYSKYEALSFLREKDWSKQPTDREVKLWTRWKAIGDKFHRTIDPHDFDTDPDAIAEALVGIQEDLNVDELKAALVRVAFWTSR